MREIQYVGKHISIEHSVHAAKPYMLPMSLNAKCLDGLYAELELKHLTEPTHMLLFKFNSAPE